MSTHGKKNGIPDRWLDYSAVGKRLQGTRFIAFRVPLKASLNRKLSRHDVFGPWELLDALNKENQELGLIIDLTNTTRYYNPADLPESLLYVKIFTAGHEIPKDHTILSFKRAVRDFLRNNADNDKLIGVHCTHGLNRTGYLICRYLIDVDGMDPKEAIQLFNSSRGHKIERQNYLNDLQTGPKRSNVGMEESEQRPIRGGATHRPSDSNSRDERQPPLSDSRPHRNFPPRDRSPRLRQPYPHNGLLPHPPPSFLPPMGADLHPYPRGPLYPNMSQWRRPPHPEEGRSKYPPDDREWRTSTRWPENSRRAPPPPPPILPRYSPQWTNESNSFNRHEEDWVSQRSRTRHSDRQTHRDRPSSYKNH
ncbi:RNA/RNP complex-1-interacting phosphatase-like [Xyrichtys novacula]|uniref:RNA/RNP complex-1-interacting phosphatase n=1 Tax=Xyrichtys novacula TaxID=13765 RepID=A0AAV1GA85_XYRNO|nr:RNA/RNP complex-1-interacting phosphatase-like [Xyrichtys novacula]